MPSDNEFTVLETVLDGFPVIAAINVAFKNYEPKRRTPWFLSISAPYTPMARGLPSSADMGALNDWEERIASELGTGAVFAGRVTWNGHRELLYYVATPDEPSKNLETLISSGTTRPFAFRFECDETWDAVGAYWER